MSRQVGVIVPAAGRGQRLGSRQAKALVSVAGRPLILHTLRALEASATIGYIVVVVRREDRRRIEQGIRRLRLRKVTAVVEGADTRSGSVAKGLAVLPASVRWVVIHDGARPCVRPALVAAVVQAVKRHGAVAAGLPASLTVKSVDEDARVRLTLDREQLWFVQTPQAFRRDWLTQAMGSVNGQLAHFPDDAAIIEWSGFPVRMVPGDPLNIKVTTPEDLLLAEAILTKGAR